MLTHIEKQQLTTTTMNVNFGQCCFWSFYTVYMPTTLPNYPTDPDLPDIALPLSQ